MSGIPGKVDFDPPATFIGGPDLELCGDMLPACHLVHGVPQCELDESDRFEGPAEASSLVSIFPLFGGSQLALRASWPLANRGRLGPPELIKTGRTGSWESWPGKELFLGSERKRRLLHGNFFQKMIPECTIFAYIGNSAFLEKSTFSGSQFRPAHSYL